MNRKIALKITVIFFLISIPFYSSLPIAASPDPEISDLKIRPTSGRAGSIYKISLRIAGTEEIVPLLHQVREGRETPDVPLRDDGGGGDAMKGDHVFLGRSVAPPAGDKQTHRFYVYVRDRAGRKSNVLEYQFTVIGREGMPVSLGPENQGDLLW